MSRSQRGFTQFLPFMEKPAGIGKLAGGLSNSSRRNRVT